MFSDAEARQAIREVGEVLNRHGAAIELLNDRLDALERQVVVLAYKLDGDEAGAERELQRWRAETDQLLAKHRDRSQDA